MLPAEFRDFDKVALSVTSGAASVSQAGIPCFEDTLESLARLRVAAQLKAMAWCDILFPVAAVSHLITVCGRINSGKVVLVKLIGQTRLYD